TFGASVGRARSICPSRAAEWKKTRKKNSSWKVMSSMGVMGTMTRDAGAPLECCSPMSGALRDHGAQLEALEPLLLAHLHQPVDAVVAGVAVGADDDGGADRAVAALAPGVQGAVVQPQPGSVEVLGRLAQNEHLAVVIDVEEQHVGVVARDGLGHLGD